MGLKKLRFIHHDQLFRIHIRVSSSRERSQMLPENADLRLEGQASHVWLFFDCFRCILSCPEGFFFNPENMFDLPWNYDFFEFREPDPPWNTLCYYCLYDFSQLPFQVFILCTVQVSWTDWYFSVKNPFMWSFMTSCYFVLKTVFYNTCIH